MSGQRLRISRQMFPRLFSLTIYSDRESSRDDRDDPPAPKPDARAIARQIIVRGELSVNGISAIL